MRFFGCHDWVRPNDIRKKQFKEDVHKGRFLDYVLHTDCLILYCDFESEHIQITSCCKFNKGFNDLHTESVPLGFQQLIRVNQDQTISQDLNDINYFYLKFFVYLFADKESLLFLLILRM